MHRRRPAGDRAAQLPGVGRNVARGTYAASLVRILVRHPSRRSGFAPRFAEAYDPWAAGEEPKYFAQVKDVQQGLNTDQCG